MLTLHNLFHNFQNTFLVFDDEWLYCFVVSGSQQCESITSKVISLHVIAAAINCLMVIISDRPKPTFEPKPKVRTYQNRKLEHTETES